MDFLRNIYRKFAHSSITTEENNTSKTGSNSFSTPTKSKTQNLFVENPPSTERRKYGDFSCRRPSRRPTVTPEQFKSSIESPSLSKSIRPTPKKVEVPETTPSIPNFEKSPIKSEISENYNMLIPDQVSKEGQIEKSAAITILSKFSKNIDSIANDQTNIYYSFCQKLDLYNRRKVKRLKKEMENQVEVYSQNQIEEAKNSLQALQNENDKWMSYKNQDDFHSGQFSEKYIPDQIESPILNLDVCKSIIIQQDYLDKQMRVSESKIDECKENAEKLASILHQISSVRVDPVKVVSNSFAMNQRK
ncbi:hypothetical protein TVAG_217240 [Trichomonas vaginalis G3]|uniref:Uncharacterized protein n=1 Tax=Trichomonas vaginalis (strain ATCC PRA-98 / G3) TaxID=412133 RepID=A2EZA6_TRIV3|nr:hypothetical protein TVAGG3_0136380 [Trichomonas vaginalis G3]EAY01987.1 hypothetical protein TVAG_217240 [Trichomonas vaginalis G3]KAI5546431.1 hypothetical protein TVAGG3_0136380 [Trichomonas vaginalis G3]|eukprot:XP_001314471.1 hypothetical protein [Trichomonas vaginalis G3]